MSKAIKLQSITIGLGSTAGITSDHGSLGGLTDDDHSQYALLAGRSGGQVLGGGTASRLFQSVREERGLAYSVYTSTAEWCDGGELVVYAGFAPSRFDEVYRLVDAELARFVADGPSEDEVAVARGFLEGSALLGTESVAGTMSGIGRALLHHDRVMTVDEHVTRYRAVGVDDVRRVAARVLTGPRAIAVVGPMGKQELGRKIRG